MFKEGFPSISIKLFSNYDAWLENLFLELGATFITTTIRDELSGVSEGLLQFYDVGRLHALMTGDEIVQISLGNESTGGTLTRMYGVKHSSVSIDQKGDSIILLNLVPIHLSREKKFGRVFYPDVKDSITAMIDSIYINTPLLKPSINGIGVHVPSVPWVLGYKEYTDFSRDNGISTQNETFCFIWEDMRGININDYSNMISSEAKNFIIGEPKQIGQYSKDLEFPLAYDVEWLTKSNGYVRSTYDDCTYYTHSFLDKHSTRIVTGDGTNSVFLTRSGGYANQQYRNGYEEYNRMHTMSQYDGYLKFTTIGNFNLFPLDKINLYDLKNQFITNFYVDCVIHEISNNTSYTHVYCFTNSKPLVDIKDIRIKNELKD